MRLTIVLIFLFLSLQCFAQEADRTDYGDIIEFIRSYAKQESKDIVIDPRVKGFVRLFSEQTPDKITKDEFHMVLLTSGFSSYEEGNLILVAHEVHTKQRNIPEYNGKSRGSLSPHQVVSTVIKVKRRDAKALVPLLKPLVEQWGYLNVDEATNTLIAVTTLSNAERLHRLVKEFDRKPVDQ